MEMRPANRNLTFALSLLLIGLLAISSCQNPYGSQYKAWRKDKKGRKEVLRAPKNMVYIPSGKFIAGELITGTSAAKNTLPHLESSEAFYIDRTEVSNQSYIIYLRWLKENGSDLDYQFALPDTNTWREPLAYNEPMVRSYLRHPSYQYYPVVGVSWVQAVKYCEWRTDRINELDSMSDDSVEIRLPTEMEWENAALTAYNYDEQTESNFRYFSIRQQFGFGRGKIMHNFQRGRGDTRGIANTPNDAAFIPAPVYMYEPNEFGLYNIYGNVAEWVSDIYLPVTIEDVTEPVNPNDSLYNNDSLKKDANFVTPEQTFKTIMDSLGIDNTQETEVETDITGDVLRVYKGGSWRDRAYYLKPGARRFLPQNVSASYVGFRCASSVPDDLKKDEREAPEESSGTALKTKEANDSTAVDDKKEERARRKAEKKAERERRREEKKKAKEKEKAQKNEEEEEDPEGE